MGRLIAAPMPASLATCGIILRTFWGFSPRASRPNWIFRSPLREGISAALMPSSTGVDVARTVPDVGGSTPAMMRRSVDLPAPFCPTRPIDSP